jgi:predicted RNA-binding protein (virulence factor B family)
VRNYCFVYLDHEERPVATTLEPYILLNEFALCVNYVNQIGALWIGEWKRHFVLKSRASYGKRKTLLGLPLYG